MLPFRVHRRVILAALGVVGALGFPALACGPSVQFIYEGNIRFEHCYRLDFDPAIAPSHRRACWAEWADRFAKGQTRDRREHARRRIAEIDSGDGAALALNIDDPADAGPIARKADPTPIPTNVHAPPPAVVHPQPETPPVSDAGLTQPQCTAGTAGIALDAGVVRPANLGKSTSRRGK